MTNQEIPSNLPENFIELKKTVNRTADWEARLHAVNELSNVQADEAIKILQYVASSDHVTKVREAAAKGLKKNGKSVPTYEAPKFGFFKDLRKVFLRIKKSLPKDHTYEDFKVKLEKMRIDIYNTYEGEKGDAFDSWLKDMWETTTSQR